MNKQRYMTIQIALLQDAVDSNILSRDDLSFFEARFVERLNKNDKS